MALFEMTGDELRALEVTTFKKEALRERQDLQRLLRRRSDVLGYIAAGGGPKWSRALKRLSPGDRIFAYVSKAGYVGYGTVSRAAAPVHLFTLDDGRSLDEHLNGAWDNHERSEDKWEYAVGVDWVRTFTIDEARSFQGDAGEHRGPMDGRLATILPTDSAEDPENSYVSGPGPHEISPSGMGMCNPIESW